VRDRRRAGRRAAVHRPPRDHGGGRDRADLYSGQSPQAFRYELLVEAHRQATAEGITDATDDAQLVLRTGGQVGVVEGSYANFKITTYQDFLFATSLVERERPNDGDGW